VGTKPRYDQGQQGLATKKNKHHPKNTAEKGNPHNGEPGRERGVWGGGKGGVDKEKSWPIARMTAFDIASKSKIPKQELLLGFILKV
jgi:hypothetical protein